MEKKIEEDLLLSRIVELHNIYISLPVQHPSDQQEWCNAIHDLQKLIALRIVRKDHPNIFPIKAKDDVAKYRSSMHDCYCVNTKCGNWEKQDRFGCRKYDFRNIEECKDYMKYVENT